ncbi:MAG: UV DNA damage repair endonuclease UvsE [Anaerolineae bacterium]|jgi:UV DNA damage endonuclease|nr:UV DNA damage repair endonuclease UvsE [Anaerolineae bacterium]MDH7474731.1 UV DNA damage repair endonuclease UvsE [Anaerolineae bacterium]
MKLGFAVKVLGEPGLKSHDTRRWQNNPHLSVSLAYLRDIFGYLRRQAITMYRMASDLAPYLTHPDLPQFHDQIEECAAELAAIGETARLDGLRLSFHPSQYVVLNAEDENVVARSAHNITALTRILDAMGLGAEAVVVIHGGGIYGDREAARQRFVTHYLRLPEAARRRLVLENDDSRFSVADVAWIHRETDIRLVFDYLHFCNHNPQRMDTVEALTTCLDTWPADVRPKVHFSSPRTAMHIVERSQMAQEGAYGLRQPRWTQHADFVDPFTFIAFVRAARTAHLRDFDVMLEAKAKDLALLRLREDLPRLSPDLDPIE